jgi:hypothetical protein
MVRTILGGVIIAASVFAQTSAVTLVPSKTSTGADKPCYFEFREAGSNGKDGFRFVCPNAVTTPVAYRIPHRPGVEHDSLAISPAPEGSGLDGVLEFKAMVTAYDDAPRIQLIEGKKRFGRDIDVQQAVAVWDDTNFSSTGPKSIFGGGYLTLREDPAAITPSALIDITGVELNDELTGTTRLILNKNGLLQMNSDAGAVKYKVENSIETLPEISTPSTLPAAGFVFRYAKAGTACTLDSGGTEVCIGASSAVTVNPISYIYSTTNQLRLEQQGDGLGTSTLFLRHRVGESGATVECSDYDLCEFNAKGPTSQMSLRMEGRSGSKRMPVGSSNPEWQFGQSTNYPNDYTLYVNQDAAAILGGKPLLLGASDGTWTGWRADAGAPNATWALPNNAPAFGECLKVLSFTLRTTYWDTCYTPTAGSNELPAAWTVSSVEKARLFSLSGNAQMQLKNSSNINGVQVGNQFGGSFLTMLDTNGDGGLYLETGVNPSVGASAYFHQADTSRIGVAIEAGAFTGDTGRVIVRDYTNNTRARMSNKFETYAAGAFPTAATELGPNFGGNGELILRDGIFGGTRLRINELGVSWLSSTPINRTFAFTTATGTCNLTFAGSFLTSFSGSCP